MCVHTATPPSISISIYALTGRSERRAEIAEWARARNTGETSKTYSRYETLYRDFCKRENVPVRDDVSVAQFYRFCLEEKAYASKTIGVISSAVSNAFRYEREKYTKSQLAKDAKKTT